MLSIRDLPLEQRAAWKMIFDHYIFDYNKEDFAHIPEQAQGVLAPINDIQVRQLRTWLINRLNR